MNYENYEISDYQEEIKDLSVQLADMLNAALYFAGVKKTKLEEAIDAYLDSMDETLGNDENAPMGFDEIVKVIKHLKNTRKDLFV
ncbi:MAG: hypothetical protein LBD84_00095 [Campylobacteraceae bacterium]|jgi:ElaB/YqjD/DUF883 family membrane-anchored ribosome-binding protein|nr:hypothetical protein [Campylobacteraceae bacterium]